MRLLLAGATGLVGGHVLRLALADPRVKAVAAPVRRELQAHPKLLAPIVDFENLPEVAPWWRADAAICALGTTIAKAGSQEAFRRVDHGHALAVARAARAHGTPAFVLNSAASASASSRIFYSRVKGELERDVELLRFESLTIVRPGLIGGERSESRPGESVAKVVLGTLAPILPRSLRINPPETIAKAMLDAAVAGRPGRHVIGAAELN